jgi:hypothetical protein
LLNCTSQIFSSGNGKERLNELTARLTGEFGGGFATTNLVSMRQFGGEISNDAQCSKIGACKHLRTNESDSLSRKVLRS